MEINQSIWLTKVIDFRKTREGNLRREYGWLSLAGLFWLREGDNTFGSAADNPIRLPERAPAQAGVFTLHHGHVTITKAPDVSIRLNKDELGNVSAALKVDTSGDPDYLFLDDPSSPHSLRSGQAPSGLLGTSLRMMVIERAGKLAIRVWDPQSPVRGDFAGCIWYEPDARFRVNAKIETYPQPRQFMIDDIVGIQRPVTMHAALAFELNGREYRLDAERQDDNSYDIIFKDTTAGKSTYAAGRYLTTEVAEGDQVIVDFNYAYNPPCAFTAFATCPLPLPQNILPVAIEAGEKFDQR
ncbi:MAG: DUF1684 domain-containing protein [Chloroflexi bacterium]|nr:DUF1684 domain-containing protein [Chloroflexota bacterium]